MSDKAKLKEALRPIVKKILSEGDSRLVAKSSGKFPNLGIEVAIETNPEDWNFFMLDPRIKTIDQDAGGRTYYTKSNKVSDAIKDSKNYQKELMKIYKDADDKIGKLDKKYGFDGKDAVDLE